MVHYLCRHENFRLSRKCTLTLFISDEIARDVQRMRGDLELRQHQRRRKPEEGKAHRSRPFGRTGDANTRGRISLDVGALGTDEDCP